MVSVVFRPLMKLRESPLSTGCSIYNKEWLEMDVSFVPNVLNVSDISPSTRERMKGKGNIS